LNNEARNAIDDWMPRKCCCWDPELLLLEAADASIINCKEAAERDDLSDDSSLRVEEDWKLTAEHLLKFLLFVEVVEAWGDALLVEDEEDAAKVEQLKEAESSPRSSSFIVGQD